MHDEDDIKLGRMVKALFTELEKLGKKPNHDGTPVYYTEEFNKPVKAQHEIKDEGNEDTPQMEIFLN